jgi:hypothetical protein
MQFQFAIHFTESIYPQSCNIQNVLFWYYTHIFLTTTPYLVTSGTYNVHYIFQYVQTEVKNE